jgi:aerobic-type carbon monoxide dehydrogenase small subunit (CoxS/CutS family)
MLVVQVSHKHVQTIEWLADQANIQPLKEAFAESGGFQCGYCTSGQLTALAALVLAGTLSDYSDEQLAYYMMGNLCRCTGYYGILRAARSTIKELAEVRGERRADV